jgi:hypothetical protein
LDTVLPRQSLATRTEDRKAWRMLVFRAPDVLVRMRDVALLCRCEAQSRHTAAGL